VTVPSVPTVPFHHAVPFHPAVAGAHGDPGHHHVQAVFHVHAVHFVAVLVHQKRFVAVMRHIAHHQPQAHPPHPPHQPPHHQALIQVQFHTDQFQPVHQLPPLLQLLITLHAQEKEAEYNIIHHPITQAVQTNPQPHQPHHQEESQLAFQFHQLTHPLPCGRVFNHQPHHPQVHDHAFQLNHQANVHQSPHVQTHHQPPQFHPGLALLLFHQPQPQPHPYHQPPVHAQPHAWAFVQDLPHAHQFPAAQALPFVQTVAVTLDQKVDKFVPTFHVTFIDQSMAEFHLHFNNILPFPVSQSVAQTETDIEE